MQKNYIKEFDLGDLNNLHSSFQKSIFVWCQQQKQLKIHTVHCEKKTLVLFSTISLLLPQYILT